MGNTVTSLTRRMLVMYDEDGNRLADSKSVDLDLLRIMAAQGLKIVQAGAAQGFKPGAWTTARKNNPEIQDEFDIGRAEGLQKVTGKLMENIDDNNQKSIEYYLNNRSDGAWSNTVKQELSGADGGAIKIAAITVDMPASEAARKYAELMKR